MSLVTFLEWIVVTSAYPSVLSKCFPLSSNIWSITSAEFYEMIFLHLYFFINDVIIDPNTWLCISLFLKSNECIKWDFGLNVDTRKVWISYNNITVWFIQIIWLDTVEIWVSSSTSTLIRLGKTFPSWWRKLHIFFPL